MPQPLSCTATSTIVASVTRRPPHATRSMRRAGRARLDRVQQHVRERSAQRVRVPWHHRHVVLQHHDHRRLGRHRAARRRTRRARRGPPARADPPAAARTARSCAPSPRAASTRSSSTSTVSLQLRRRVAPQPRDGEADRRERILELVRHLPRRLAQRRARSASSARTRPSRELRRHLAHPVAQHHELRRALAAAGRRAAARRDRSSPSTPPARSSGRLRLRLRCPATREATSPISSAAAERDERRRHRRAARHQELHLPRVQQALAAAPARARRAARAAARVSGRAAHARRRAPRSRLGDALHRRRRAQQGKRTHDRRLPRRRRAAIVGMSAKPSRMRKRRARKPTCFTGAPYGRAREGFRGNIQAAPGATTRHRHDGPPCARTPTTSPSTRATRQEIIDITDDVEACRAAAGIREGMVLVSAMHISASVFVNDHEPGLWKDILEWLETRIAPWDPERYRHNSRHGRGQRRRAPALAHHRARGDRAGHRRPARSRSLAARLLRRMGRPAAEAGDPQGDGRSESLTQIVEPP